MATLKDLLAQEAALSSQLAALSSQQQALEHSFATVRVRIGEIQNMNTAIYNFPSETLSAIFEACLPETSSPSPRAAAFLERSKEPLPVPVEMVVSAVSRRWRNVALQTPQLWTNICINLAQPMQVFHDLYLHRSKMCLLDIIMVPFGRHKADFTHARDIGISFKQHMELLIPHVVRWRKLVIRSAFTGEFSTPYSVLGHLYAPALETLEADIHCQPRLAMEVFSGGAPRLSSVELDGVYFRPPQGAVKYLGLSYIAGPSLSHDQFSQLIRPMCSLTHLMMDSTIFNDTNCPSIELPSVISLDIGLNYHSVGALRFLDFPAVEKLTFRGYSLGVIEAVAQHGRLYPAVTSLTIANWDIDRVLRDNMPAAIIFMSLLPNVRDVTFQRVDSTPILRALHASTDTVLWPRLFAITVTPAVKAKVSLKIQTWDYIVKVVESRLLHSVPISHITLSSQIIERISNKRQRWLRGEVTLTDC